MTHEQPDLPRRAWTITLFLLAALGASKTLGHIPLLGTLAFTLIAVGELYIPIARCDAQDKSIKILGLHTSTWRKDMWILLAMIVITFPLYAAGFHFTVTKLHLWLPWVPHWEINSRMLSENFVWSAFLFHATERTFNHILGVALPEETFFRGYLQSSVDNNPRWHIAGAHMGLGAITACAAFALGHFMGEWNPLRLLPFFPGLLFAWLRAKTGSLIAPIGYHAACNLLGELLASMYHPYA